MVFDLRNDKTHQFMLDEGLGTEDIFAIIKEIGPEEFHKGPLGDRDGTTGNIMIFMHPYGKIRLYVKLKLWADESGDHGSVISVHPEGIHGRGNV